MSEFDELENMFSNAFSGETATPPAEVKTNIDKELFGTKGRVIWLFGLLLLLILPIGGYLIYTNYTSDADSKSAQITKENNGTEMSFEESGNSIEDQAIMETEQGAEDMIASHTSFSDSDRREGGGEVNSTSSLDEGSVEERSVVGTGLDRDIFTAEKLPLLSSVQVDEKPNPYDLLFMCATKPYIKQRKPISLDVYAGVESGRNNYDYTVNTFAPMDRSLSEDLGISFSLEASVPIGQRFSLASGVGLNHTRNMFVREWIGADSTYVGDTLVVTQYWDPINMVTVTDSSYEPMYEYSEVEKMAATSISRTSYFIPLYLKYERAIGFNWRVGASVGARFSYDQLKFLDNQLNLQAQDFKRFGMSAIFRPEIGYAQNKWQLGAYGQVGYDLMHGLSGDITRVKRYSFGGGLRFRYTF